MGSLLSYKEELTKAMTMLAQDPRTLFIGQNVVYGGAVDIPATLAGVPAAQKLEFPVAEDLQLGVCIGLALVGYLPICIYPRMDFLVLAMNQLVNHLDKFNAMSVGRYRPRVIIRTALGSHYPLDAGPQHTGDYTKAVEYMVIDIDVVPLEKAEEVIPAYKRACASPRSTILIERMAQMR